MQIPIYFNDTQISQLPVYDDLMITRELMGVQEIKVEIELPGALHCPVGAYIIHKGKRYTVNTSPSPEKTGSRRFKYTIVFESDVYRLYDKKVRHLNRKTFQYYGAPSDLAQLIVDNINQIDGGWTVGICEAMPEKSLDFDGHTCRTALDTIAEAFTLEWQVVDKVISFVKQVGNVTSHVFEYGRGKGLYTIAYEYQNDKNIVTRAYGYGSPRNLPSDYREGANQLMFAEGYLEKNVHLYGVKEGDFETADIYPTVDGQVNSVSVYDPDAGSFTIIDSTLTFNLKDHFSTDTPKISFLTGELQGQEFEILDYTPGTKAIKIKVFSDDSDNRLPNEVFQAQVGDKYTLFDMFLPVDRVATAELLLKQKTQEWLDENSVPRVLYKVELDPLHARNNGIVLNVGDKVHIKDADLGIDTQIRVTKTSYPVKFPEELSVNTKIEIEIANFIPYTTTERVIADTIDNQKEIRVVDRTNAQRARRNSVNLRTLQSRIFNPDGTLFEGPESLVAGMAAFGYDSQNFNLNDVTISPNAGADENSLIISGGTLIHSIYSVQGVGSEWVISQGEWSGLDPAKFYYVYAKCNKAALNGAWEISETPVKVNDIPGYFAFNLGILYEVNSGDYRDFEFTKGMTYIVGDQITTGRIKSLSGENYFDLNSGKFNIGNEVSGLDWNETTPDTLTIRGAIASEVIKVGSGGVINARVSGITDPINPSQSVRFAAGPADQYKVLDDGSFISTKGRIGNWQISAGGILNEDGTAYIISRDANGDGTAQAMIGTNVFPATSGAVGVAYFENSKNNPFGVNYGAVFNASGGLFNIAAQVNGIFQLTGDFVVGNMGDSDNVGLTFFFDYQGHGSAHDGRITVKKGIIVKQEEYT